MQIIATGQVVLPMANPTDPIKPRRETKTERKHYSFKASVLAALTALSEREGISEAEAVSRAVEKEARKLPLLGEIPCGPLEEIPEDHIEGYLSVGDLYKVRDGDFLLKARGDSMVGDGIDEGDYVLIRPQTTCDSGDIAAVVVDYPTGPRATLKKVVFSGDKETVKLVSMNDAYDPITVNIKENPLRICGVRRGVIKVH